LDKNKTTPYALYQYFMNTTDDDIERYLKMLTLIEVEDIQQHVKDHVQAPEQRKGQKLLAYSVVEIIHGSDEADFAQSVTQFMFTKNKTDILNESSADTLVKFQQAIGGYMYKGENLFETMVSSGLATSNSDARKALTS
jgi:tyrosyl-tRNA synthetase